MREPSASIKCGEFLEYLRTGYVLKKDPALIKLKSNDDRPSPCFKPFVIGNMSDNCFSTRTLLYVSVRHILLDLPIS
jgi:hypothetical protein